MTTQLLANELANLIQESKRKHNDLRQAAEKSLEELKQLGNVSEQAAPELLSQKPNFVNPFIIACGTKNAKFTAIAIVCLQRLIVACALPEAKLNQVLEALMQASSAGLDVQLKILQALPSLLQNYSSVLRGDLLVTTLNICFILQSSKNAIVNNTSAATLQQLVVSVFDKVVTEDRNDSGVPTVGEAPSANGSVQLRAAALDAYRIFNDLCLMTENQRPEFLRFSNLPQTFGLELIESVITNHASVFTSHPEQAQVLRVRVMPLIVSALKAKPLFATTVRLVRILYTMLRRHLDILPRECGDALEILTHLLDQEAALWKRALCMEVFRGIFADYALVRKIYSLYDAQKNEKGAIKILVATFVRLSTEKPAVIGLGHQSTVPMTVTSNASGMPTDQAMLEAGMSGIIGGSIGSESSNTGISTQWSSVRVPCIDQLDKTEPPPIPESYVYSLILSCLSSLSDGLAKFILPLTVPSESRNRRKLSQREGGRESSTPLGKRQSGRERAASFKKNPVPVNPLQLEDHPMYQDVKICASIVDECWPAILATFSTFLYAALDSEYYHGLVRSFQRFAHVSGLLQLVTPRDAFLTTLGKSAVPPNLLTACVNSGLPRPSTPSTPSETASTLFNNARGLLSVEALGSGSPSTEKQRQAPFDTSASLNTRNLLCLRALLNLGIALGPTLGSAWGIIFETLQQADFVLFATGKTPGRTPSIGRAADQASDADTLMSNFSNEIRSVETAASRLIESTVDFPNVSFVEVVEAVCSLLEKSAPEKSEAGDTTPSPAESQKQLGHGHRRVLSFSSPTSTSSNQEFLFALTKLGEIASINLERLLMDSPDVSGWNILTHEIIHTVDSPILGPPVRVKAAEILSRLALEAATATSLIPEDSRGAIQLRLLASLRDALTSLNKNARAASVSSAATDIDVHRIILEGLQSIIEGCGENLVSGWDVAFDIIGSGFVSSSASIQERKRDGEVGLLSTRSPRLTRSAFGSLQLICSDFLSSLPNSCFLILVDTLYKFCSQDDDLNIALTTVTFFWVLSDFLSAKANTLEITADLVMTSDESELRKNAADHTSKGSDAALWMLLLLRLATVTSDERLDLRNSAIQTLLRIFDAYGDRLSSEAWSICIKSVIFKLFTSLEEELRAASDGDVDVRDRVDWHGTAAVVLDGVSSLLANHINALTSHSAFNQLWRELLQHFATLLDFNVLDINTATFKALSHVLSQNGDNQKPTFSKSTVEFAWDLWARGVPTSKPVGDEGEDNQNCLVAYVAALREVYKLIQADLSVDTVKRMLTLLRQTVQEASVGTYVKDIEHTTNLQGQILAVVEMIRTDVEGVPSAMIKQVSEFITLAYVEELYTSGSKRTYVAMSKASMKLVERLILNHASDRDIYQSGSFSEALSALHKPVALKYGFPVTSKSGQPWRLATSSVLSVLDATLPQVDALDLSRQTGRDIWVTVVAVADGILSAEAGDPSAIAGNHFEEDERFDISSFHKLRALIVPSLGAENVPNAARKAYAESLFRNSIIHSFTNAERHVSGKENELELSSLYETRPGRTIPVPPTRRKNMAYVAYEELFSLVSVQEGVESTKPNSTTTKKTKKEKNNSPREDASTLHNRIASTLAPFFILRCALAIRAYVADQPLRGHMPQPLSQRKELVWTLTKLVELESRGEAIPSLKRAEGENRKHLLRLYPLLVRALGVGGDDVVLKLLGEALEAVGGELGIV
ncbi:Endocytosis and vacuole integrity protein [Conoideocrella luteorostrata]|uniref:Endocytosis and vacuole integrity protein n=1 Tax=Conoideocrella luteorostrata TaxID=1105319 RepID=A0AAJ0CYY5_9HYPO|nr:Endocytosis and vacuole integrity protein [Conoideocrella luteorostrata]